VGASVYLQFINRDTGNSMIRSCTITDASYAECMYILTHDDLSEAGNFLTEITVEYLNGTKLTYQNPIVLIVVPEIVNS
jgi:hypothetical protein